MATLTEVEASIRASTDQGDTGRTPQSVIYQFTNDDYQDLCRRIAAFAPQQYSKVSAELTVATGATSIDVSSLTDLLQISEVQRKSSNKWISLRPAEYNAELNSFHSTWEQEGFPGAGCKVNVYPAERAPGTYRIKYVKLVPTLTAGSDVLQLPPGGECVLIHTVSGRIRVREEEDPSAHFALAEKAFDGLKQNLTPKYGVIGSRGQYR
jgi:hypothetical protein